MQVLTMASDELFSRRPDERFETLQELWNRCHNDKRQSLDRWHPPQALKVEPAGRNPQLVLGQDGTFQLNDWSFSQLCRLANVSKDTVNRVSSDTACRILTETLPTDGKPLQALTLDDDVRALHAASYTRLYNVDLLTMLREFATDFQPPQKGVNGATGLYCGEQDMFCFLIDPTGWAEIDGEAFAPGFFLWNSEVGRRSVGVQTFWFQAVCANHIVWDAIDVVEFTRKHTANVHEAIDGIRRVILNLVEKRDERRDGFVRVISNAMKTKLGENADAVIATLVKNGIGKSLAKQALEIAQRQGRFTIFSIVDALTRLSGSMKFAGDRAEADEKAGKLLALAA